jgi:predicted DNA-binding protein (MmcQ/YjbR family)
MAKTKRVSDAVVKQLRAFGLAYPGAHLKSPWPGHKDLAVNDKTFAYLSIEGEPFSISCKLPASSAMALMLPFTKPAEYGLGKSGWVAATFGDREALPVEMLKAWIDESYRAQAPKKLIATLDGAPAPAKPAKPAKSKRTPRRVSKR